MRSHLFGLFCGTRQRRHLALTAAALLAAGPQGAAWAHGKGASTSAGMHGTHRHAEWVPPPPEYADRRSTRWADLDAIRRGQSLYARHCSHCHGEDGRGTGPAAAALAHKPADLTNHFHQPPHDGDAYLFWRVSEGGTVPPFSGMGSQMPAFKHLLSEGERWDVLAYVHAYFHLGLARWRMDQGGAADGPRQARDGAHGRGGHGHEGE